MTNSSNAMRGILNCQSSAQFLYNDDVCNTLQVFRVFNITLCNVPLYVCVLLTKIQKELLIRRNISIQAQR